MKEEIVTPAAQVIDPTAGYVPFVNEECGDTMWDEVLKELDKKRVEPDWKGIDILVSL